MKNNLLRTYKYYKSLYPSALILFHIQNNYVALYEDARVVEEILGAKIIDNASRISEDDILCLSQLSESYGDVRIIEYRNDDGELDFADIDEISMSSELDY